MGFSDVGKLVLASVIPLSVGVLFVIIGTATNYWQSSDSSLSKYNSGLWNVCSGSTCVSYQDSSTPDWLKAVRAFVILAILTLVGAIITTVGYILKSDIKILEIVALVLAYVGGVCAFIGIGIYGGKYSEDYSEALKELYKLSWSLALTAVGGVLGIVGGVLITLDKVMN